LRNIALDARYIPMRAAIVNAPVGCYHCRMIRWNVTAHMQAKGWQNANQLARGAGLSYPGAARVLEAEPLDRIDVSTLERMSAAFGVSPWRLLTVERDGNKQPKRR
jgi:transcriptional regulator with XRE-family HTH domain